MSNDIKKIRWLTSFFIFGLIISGLTAFPLLIELNILSDYFIEESKGSDPSGYTGVKHWILNVREGLEVTYSNYPFIGYGTDWLAYGHIVIALFFIPAFKDPIRYRRNYDVGIWASFLVIPLAFICGEVRGIPVYWRMIDSMFGVVALIPLFYIKNLIAKIETNETNESVNM